MALGTDGPGPFAGELGEPQTGVLAGHGQFHWTDPGVPWRGGRWLLVAQDGQRYPLTLEVLLRGSGVEKDGALDEHRAALRAVSAVAGPAAEVDWDVHAGAIEWLLYDWLMAHRESTRSAAIEIRSGRPADAALLIAAAAATAEARERGRARDWVANDAVAPSVVTVRGVSRGGSGGTAG